MCLVYAYSFIYESDARNGSDYLPAPKAYTNFYQKYIQAITRESCGIL